MGQQAMQEFFDKGDYKALKDLIEIESSKSTKLQVEGLIYQSRMMYMLNKMTEGQEFADQAIEISANNKLHELEIRSLIAKGFSCGKAHHGLLNSIFTNLNILLSSTHTSAISNKVMQNINADIYFLKGWYYATSNQLDLGWQEFEKAIPIVRNSGSKGSLCEILLYYGFSCMQTSSRGVESIDYLEEALKLSRDLENPHLMGLAYNWFGSTLAFNQDVQNSFQYFDKGVEIYKSIGQEGEGQLGRIYNNLAVIHRNQEEFEKSIEYSNLNLEISEKLNNKSTLAFAHMNLSEAYKSMNQFEKAIFHMKKTIEIGYQINQKQVITNSHQGLGHLYLNKGDVNLAEKEFLLVEQLLGETGDLESIAWIKTSLCSLYTIKMQTDKAFEKINETLMMLGDIKAYHQIGWLYLNEGINFRTIGNSEMAIQSFDKANEIWGKIPDPGHTGVMWRSLHVLFQKIVLMNEMGKFKKANNYFEELTKITQTATTPGIVLRKNFLKGLILKSKDRIGEKFKAQEIFQEIVEDQIVDVQIYSLSLLNLCDLLILEIKISTSPEDRLNELTTLVHRMTEIGKTQDIPNLMVMGEVIHGKINLIQNDLGTARSSFEQAKVMAEEHNLQYLISKVQIEQDYVEQEISKWTDVAKIDLTLSERVEKAQIQEYLTHAISVKEKMVNSSSTTTS